MDDPNCPEEIVAAGYRDIVKIHRWLGNLRAVERAIRGGGRTVRRVLDVGCGRGGVLRELERRLGVETVGVDLRPWPGVLQRDALRDALPEADIGICVCVAHHFSEEGVERLIRNVRRSCPRFLLLDLVRHPLPLWLYRLFVAPLVAPVVAHDGALSVRRAFTAQELRRIAAGAVDGAPFRHSVAPFYIRQVIDI